MRDERKINIVRTDFVEGRFLETMKVEVDGTYMKKDDTHFLFCGAFDKNEDKNSKHRFTIKAGRVELKTTGDLSYTMIFSEGKREELEYSTPYGNIKAVIYTKAISLKENEGSLRVKISFHTLLDELDKPNMENESSILVTV